MACVSRMCLRLLLLASLGSLLISGCVDLGVDPVEENAYLLNVSRGDNASAAVAALPSILQIRPFRISPRFEDKKLVYRMDDNRYVADYYNRFLIAPAVMVTEEVRQWVEAAGLFEVVLAGPSRIEADLFLEGRITALYGDFRESPPLAVAELEFTVLRERPASPELLLRRSYRREIPLSKQSPEALVRGFNEAAGKIFTNFEQDMRRIDADRR